MKRVVRYEPCPSCRSKGRDTRGDNLVRYADGGGHCFSCGRHESSPVTAEKLFNRKEVDDGTKSILPGDFTREVPTAAWKWLFQYGLPYSYWKERCGYSPKDERLVFLIGEPVAFSIGRLIPQSGAPVDGHGSVDDSGGSAARGLGRLSPVHGTSSGGRGQQQGNHASRRKWYVWGDSHKHCEIVSPSDPGRVKTVVLVEDLISAHKVGQITTAIPLFGTVVHPCHLYYLMQQDKPITLWLDKDQEQNVQKTALRLQSLVDVPVRVVVTDDDPKKLPYEVIESLL